MPKNTRTANRMGSIRKRPDGRWEGRYTGADGRQHSIYGKSQREVAEALRSQQHAVDAGSWIEPHRMTVAEWIDLWLSDYAGNSDRTRDYYRRICTLYALPTLGEVRLSALTVLHVRHMVKQLQRRTGEDALSSTTVAQALAVLRIALGVAVTAKLLSTNPATEVPLPKKEKTTMHIIDRPMIPAFLAATQATHYPEALTLLLQTGLRSGELRGLTWDDIDEAHSTIYVRHQLDLTTPGAPALRPPKDDSTRDIIVGPEVLATLKAQRKRLAEHRLKAGPAWREDDFSRALVVRSIYGNPMDAKALYRAVKTVGGILEIPDLHPHDLRHSYAVAALRAGADVKTVQHNLGHASAKMTMDVYAAYTTDAAQTAAARLSAYWSDAAQTPN